jgi:hypothetical protein
MAVIASVAKQSSASFFTVWPGWEKEKAKRFFLCPASPLGHITACRCVGLIEAA